jgi:hypothetical protein
MGAHRPPRRRVVPECPAMNRAGGPVAMWAVGEAELLARIRAVATKLAIVSGASRRAGRPD